MLEKLYPIRAYNVKRGLLLFSALIFLWFGGKAIFELLSYARLSEYAPVLVENWEVEKQGSSYRLLANYIFEIKGKKYEGSYLFKEPVFLNQFSAEDEKNLWKASSWYAWYSPRNPQFSSLQKLFPYKSCSYAIVTFFVLIFFTYKLFREPLEKA